FDEVASAVVLAEVVGDGLRNLINLRPGQIRKHGRCCAGFVDVEIVVGRPKRGERRKDGEIHRQEDGVALGEVRAEPRGTASGRPNLILPLVSAYTSEIDCGRAGGAAKVRAGSRRWRESGRSGGGSGGPVPVDRQSPAVRGPGIAKGGKQEQQRKK